MKVLIGTAIGMVLLAIFAIGSLLIGVGANREHSQKVKSTIREGRVEPAPGEGVVLPAEEPVTQTVDVAEQQPTMQPNILVPMPGADVTANPGQVYSQAQQRPAPAIAAPPALPDPRQVRQTSIPRGDTSNRPSQATSGSSVDVPAPIIVEEHSHIRNERHERNRTSPEPVYQPVPSIEKSLREGGTFKARLTVGADGRVREVDVLQPLSGATARLIGAIQQWRFRPATEDGRAVEGTFDTELSFNAQQ